MLFHVKPSHWWTSYWRLGQKIESQSGVPTANDVRKAAILRQQAATLAHAGSARRAYEAAETMEWVIDYGRKVFEDELAARKAEARMGA